MVWAIGSPFRRRGRDVNPMHTTRIRPSVLLASMAIVAAGIVPAADAAIRHVDGTLTTGAGNGTSWADAYRGPTALTAAISASVSGDEIWVKAGTYRPSDTGSRTASFVMRTGVGIYGGFAGTETQRDQRNIAANETILSGDLLGNDTTSTTTFSDNSYHVVLGSSVASSAVLDGFTVRAGNANLASSNNDKGGGILVLTSGQPTVRHCRFVANRCTFGGGAGYIFGAGGTFVRCEFIDNVGGSYGGAFDCNNTTVTWESCLFRNNAASRAGAIESFGSSQSRITNCIFVANRATGSNGGAAVWIGSSSAVTMRNCTLYANVATSLAGGIINTSGSSTVANCIFWANTGPGGTTAANQVTNSGGTTTVSHSIVQGGFTGTGNVNADPQFVDAAAGDFRLQATSPALDSGANASVPAGVTTDFAGNARFVDSPAADSGSGTAPVVDRGALEWQPSAPACPADVTGDGTTDGFDIAALLSGWGSAGDADINGDGTINGLDLTALLSAWGPCP
ncbi:MAG: DUF5123 domain-containing protein [Phycisphaerales bacterium]|nr:DUF5123 domain-containing protein [Phycisphaerales bacterium]